MASISKKQMQILAFPYTKYTALVCDGAVRSGKTSLEMVAFIDWAMRTFTAQRFGICGKTIDSAKKNIIQPYMAMSWPKRQGYTLAWHAQEKVLEVTCKGRTNFFEVFGGRDESSYQLIQGRTLAGVLLDEVTLMPESFVNQALARCSVGGSKLWFSCNPDSPVHWFKRTWIDEADKRGALHLHFLMTDNTSLSDEVLRRYESLYSGVFYRRYILGEWVKAEGLVWPRWEDVIEGAETLSNASFRQYCISIDYGTQNAFAALLWARDAGGIWHCIREFYFSGRAEGHQKTDEEYADAVVALAHGLTGTIEVIVDPSAASFIAALKRRGRFMLRKARNDVLDGIREVDTCMQAQMFKISDACRSLIGELSGYVWDEKAGVERPYKVDDHACDAMRYFIATKRVIGGLKTEETVYTSPFRR